MKNNIHAILLLPLLGLLVSCASTIEPVGNIGPKKLGVYEISHSDFLSASRILVILDEKGNVAAYSGGTVSGLGSVGMQTAGTLAMAGSMIVGANAIEKGLTNMHTNVGGIPSHVNVDVTGQIKK